MQAIYAYSAREAKEISFDAGALITVHEIVSDDWWIGECYGEKGYVPSAYLNPTPVDPNTPLPARTEGKVEAEPSKIPANRKEYLGERPDLGKAIKMHHVKNKHDIAPRTPPSQRNEFQRQFTQMKKKQEK